MDRTPLRTPPILSHMPGEILDSEFYDLPVFYSPNGEVHIKDDVQIKAIENLLSHVLRIHEEAEMLHYRFIGDLWLQSTDGRYGSKSSVIRKMVGWFNNRNIIVFLNKLAKTCEKWRGQWRITRDWKWHEDNVPTIENEDVFDSIIEAYPADASDKTPPVGIPFSEQDGLSCYVEHDGKIVPITIPFDEIAKLVMSHRRFAEMCLELSPLSDTHLKSTRFSVAALKKMPYQVYLQTDHWKDISRRVKESAGKRCSQCGNPWDLQSHHLTYERKGCELLSDLICVCKDCHGILHGEGALEAPKR